MLLGEGHVGEDVFLCAVHERRELRQLRAHLIRDLAPLGLGRRVVGLGKGRGDESRDRRIGILRWLVRFAGLGGVVLMVLPAAAQERHALVMGINAYESVPPLATAVNDAV
jgi:hypothetical protein